MIMTPPSQPQRVAFHTLGCKLNFAETSTIARSLPAESYIRVPFNKEADIYVINTCSVTTSADRKCRQVVKKITGRHPDAFIVVVGCYSQLRPDEIASIPGVDLILGTNEKFDLLRYIGKRKKSDIPKIESCDISSCETITPSWSAGERTRTFLKVQDGCDYSCAYCTIPLARGSSRNIPIKECVAEANKIAEAGILEIVLTGVNTGDFGRTTGESFIDLLSALTEVEGIERYRISSIEPNLLTSGIIDLVAGSRKLMPHFHIPLQSGCNSTLARMKRRYSRELFALKVKEITKKIPGAGIGADVITGFPGESDEEFKETFKFLKGLPLSYLHVFRFSERPGTPAATMPGRVNEKKRYERSKLLSYLSDSLTKEFCRRASGRESAVLFEGSSGKGHYSGFTENYIKVTVPSQERITGTIRQVVLNSLSDAGGVHGSLKQL